MENPKDQIAAKLKDANNVLVTVSANPSVDQLCAAIGLTILLTKLKKHATAVFSGRVPSTIEFLKPEETIEATTDSLRDFIIALDKSKADKIRYKVEENMVKIFITPYRTSIGEPDLVFSQGDFNVDIVIALGVHQKEDLDQAITAHGRILHDATVATINTQNGSELGSLNWTEPGASSLCEMVVTINDLLKTNVLDAQIATALLTGIVAETARFSNEKTSSVTMNASAKLMAAGANQQLVATKLQEGPAPEPAVAQPAPATPPKDHEQGDDGSLQIHHDVPPTPPEPPTPGGGLPPVPPLPPTPAESPFAPPPPPLPLPEPPPAPQIQIDDQGQLGSTLPPPTSPLAALGPIQHPQRSFLGSPLGQNTPPAEPTTTQPGGDMDTSLMDNAAQPEPSEPPSLGLPAAPPPPAGADGALNLPPVGEDTGGLPPLPLPPPTPSLPPKPKHKPEPEEPASPLPKSVIDVMDSRTLNDIETAVDSPHKEQTAEPPLDFHAEATKKVAQAVSDKTLHDIEESTASPHLQYEDMLAASTQPPQEASVTLPPQEPTPPLAVSYPALPGGQSEEMPAEPAAPAIEVGSEMDEAAIRARIDSALAASDQAPQQPIAALNATGELDVSHEQSEDQGPRPKQVHIDKDTGHMHYPENHNGSVPADTPPPVPPPFTPPPIDEDTTPAAA